MLDAFRSISLAPIGSVDHYTILLAPAYRLVIRRVKKINKNIKQLTSDSIQALQGCCESTDWINLRIPSKDMEEQVDVVLSNMNFSVDSITSKMTSPGLQEIKEIRN